VAMFASGCGGPDGSGTGGTGGGTTTPQYAYPTAADFCQKLAEDECNETVVKACYGSDATSLATDVKSCEAARAARCAANTLPYHPEHAEECLQAHKDSLADAIWSHDEIKDTDAACLPVFNKMESEGAVCTADTDCDATQELHCLIKLGAIQGVCGKPKLVVGGAKCDDPVAVCDDANYCDPKIQYCLARQGEAKPCSAAQLCIKGMYCTDPDMGQCLKQLQNGNDCTKDDVCAGGFCIGATANQGGKCSSTLPLLINTASCAPYLK
jgi:hypothetical protein